jgi:hypothetical protein
MSTVIISGAPPGRVADGGPIPSKTGFKTNNEGFAKTAKIAMNSGDEQMAVSEATLGPDTGWKPLCSCARLDGCADIVLSALFLVPIHLFAWTNGELLIWMDNQRGRALGPIAQKFQSDLGLKVTIETPEKITDTFPIAPRPAKDWSN